jgi:malate synthase
MSMKNIEFDLSFPEQYWTHDNQEILPPDLLKLISKLHHEFEPRRQELLESRRKRQKEYDEGKLPEYLDRNSAAVKGDWRVAPVPDELSCRRVEITGPVNSAKMVINMLSRNQEGVRADMAMLDFEDSMKPTFSNVLDGYKNVISAVSGNLFFYSSARTYKLDPQDMAYIMVRVRGLHLDETNVQVSGTPVSAGLLDLIVCFYHTAKLYLSQNKTPKYYVPKCEHFLEARWWNDLFTALEESLGFPESTLRATFLIETLPATFQVEEILYEIRNHAAGLNVGRWDKIFSDIKILRNHSDRIMPDRATINMTKYWMENYAKRVIQICHTRGAFAMGGMSAFTPGTDAELREEQTRKVMEDKRREAQWGHDGCWVSHPYFIGVAMAAFERKNQLDKTLPEFDKYSDILPSGEGAHSLSGLRTNVRVGIAYMHGWNKDIGCVSFDNLMEDLATLEISRAQAWQWLHHGIVLDEGMKVDDQLMQEIFREETEKIIEEFGEEERQNILESSESAKKVFLQKNLSEFLTTASEPAK